MLNGGSFYGFELPSEMHLLGSIQGIIPNRRYHRGNRLAQRKGKRGEVKALFQVVGSRNNVPLVIPVFILVAVVAFNDGGG